MAHASLATIILSPTEQALLYGARFSNKKERYLRYRIRKKLAMAKAAAAQQTPRRCRDSLYRSVARISRRNSLYESVKSKEADPPSFDLGICGSEDRRDILATLRAQQES